MRRSMYSSPGNHGSWSGGMVFTYGVETVAGKPTWAARARSRSFMSRKRARALPRASTTASKESSHSAVSSGSVSGSWWEKPSNITPTILAPGPVGPKQLRWAILRRGRDRLHRRRLPGEPRSGRLGLGGAGRALRRRAGPAQHQPEDGDHRRAGGPGRAGGGGSGLLGLHLRRQLLPGPLVRALGAEGLAELPEQAGGQPGPVGPPPSALPAPAGRDQLPLGEGPRLGPHERPGGPPGGGGRHPAGPPAGDRAAGGPRPRRPAPALAPLTGPAPLVAGRRLPIVSGHGAEWIVRSRNRWRLRPG